MEVPEGDNDKLLQNKVYNSFLNANVAHVEGAAELIVEPDVVEFLFCVESRKEKAEDAKHSVSKRIDYLTQIVKNAYMKGDMTVTTSRKLSHRDEHFFMTGEVLVQCSAEERYDEIINIVIEKLENGVKISEPHFFHSTKCIQEGRQQALKMAINNARLKAVDIAASSGQQAGQALNVDEKENSLCRIKLPSGSLGSSLSKRRFAQAQEIRSKIVAVYELISMNKCK